MTLADRLCASWAEVQELAALLDEEIAILAAITPW